MDDLIRRADAIMVASGYCHWTNIPDELAKLPSVNPIPCEDAISRKAVLMELDKYLCGVPFDEKGIDEVIKELPSVTVREKTGHWIRMKAYEKWGCSECYTVFRFTFKEHDYCPNCGCKMEVET